MKRDYMDELRKLAGYDEDGNELDELSNIDEQNKSGVSGNGKAASEEGQGGEEADAEQKEPPFATDGSMECRILLKEKDMRHFMFRHTYTGFSGWFGVMLSVIALVMLVIGWRQYDIIHIVALGILALLFTVVQPAQIVLRAKRQIMNQDMFRDTLIYNLCKEGILVRQGEQYVNVVWKSIRKVVYTRKAVFVYTSPVRAFILPYDQIGDIDGFKRILREKAGR